MSVPGFHAHDHFTPFAARRAELRAETFETWSAHVRAQTRALTFAMTVAALIGGLAVGTAWSVVIFKRAPEFARAIEIERPA